MMLKKIEYDVFGSNFRVSYISKISVKPQFYDALVSCACIREYKADEMSTNSVNKA